MLCAPSVSEEVVNEAAPAAKVAVPIAVPPSKNVTVPVGVPEAPVTVAVNVTACPTELGLTEDESVVEVVVGAGAPTVRVAVAVLPLPPSLEVTADVVLTFVPAVGPVTLIENVQEAFAASVAPDKLALLPPAVAAIVPPPHDPVSPLGVATTRPERR
jgi:hypothetical protein